MRREPQLRVDFSPGRALDDYYNDLRLVARPYGSAAAALDGLRALTADRERANAVSVAQLGLGAWQLRGTDAAWLEVTKRAADWTRSAMDATGGIAHGFPMPHTYRIEPPWLSAMAQGEAASLLVRAAQLDGDADHLRGAADSIRVLLDPGSPIVTTTPEGTVLQEYPSDPPAHVLNGWIFALWGLHDVGVAPGVPPETAEAARRAFDDGCATLERRLPLYRTFPRWSRYDLFPHPLTHVASPFYHRLHVEQLAALGRLRPSATLAAVQADWERGASSLPATGAALTRKVAFRLVRPRHVTRLWPFARVER